MTVKLKANGFCAKISSRGAELDSLTDSAGKEYIWQKDSKYWAKSSPLLFPIVGNLRDDKTKIGGEWYSLSKHGFCREREFEVTRQTENEVDFTLKYSDETLEKYPFKFLLTLSYKLDETGLSIKYIVKNIDDKKMYYCIGAHPAFNIPTNEFENCSLVFNKPETNKTIVYDVDGLYFDANRRVDYTGGTNKFDLKYSCFDEDAVVFDETNSDSVELINNKTGEGVRVDYNGFSSIAFWTPVKMNAPFLCIEPWNGMAVRSDESDNYEEKYGVLQLAPNMSSEHCIKIAPLK